MPRKKTQSFVPLKYLFGVHFKDGTELFQNPEDKPQIAESGSAYSDVIARLQDVELFQLHEPEFQDTQTGNRYLVDLRDGHFEVNGAPVFLADPNFDPKELVYFRRNRISSRGTEIVGHTVEYHIGWQVAGQEPVTLRIW